MTSGRTVGRTTVAAPISRPAVADRHSDGEVRVSSNVNAPTMSTMASRSAMIRCSMTSCEGSNRTGMAASVAAHSGRPYRRSTAYTMPATTSPSRCWRITTRTSERNGSSSHKNSE